jgi:hypothetical protein
VDLLSLYGLVADFSFQMTRSRVSLRGSRPGSPGGSSEEDSSDTNKSPVAKDEKTPIRGRKDQRTDGEELETDA